MPNINSPQIISVSIETITVKDVFDLTIQNINPLMDKDLKKILDQSRLQAKLCDNPVLVSVDEIHKSMTNTIREELKTQEPPTITPQVTNVKSLDKVSKVTLEKVDTIGEDKVETQATIETQSQIGQLNSSVPPTQVQGAIQGNVVEKDKPKETKLTPNLKELATIQAQ